MGNMQNGEHIRVTMQPGERLRCLNIIDKAITQGFNKFKKETLQKAPEDIFEDSNAISYWRELVAAKSYLFKNFDDICVSYLAGMANPAEFLLRNLNGDIQALEEYSGCARIANIVYEAACSSYCKEARTTTNPDRMLFLLGNSYDIVSSVIKEMAENPAVTFEILDIIAVEIEPYIREDRTLAQASRRISELREQQLSEDEPSF